MSSLLADCYFGFLCFLANFLSFRGRQWLCVKCFGRMILSEFLVCLVEVCRRLSLNINEFWISAVLGQLVSWADIRVAFWGMLSSWSEFWSSRFLSASGYVPRTLARQKCWNLLSLSISLSSSFLLFMMYCSRKKSMIGLM